MTHRQRIQRERVAVRKKNRELRIKLWPNSQITPVGIKYTATVDRRPITLAECQVID